jgi:hypothetical protein
MQFKFDEKYNTLNLLSEYGRNIIRERLLCNDTNPIESLYIRFMSILPKERTELYKYLLFGGHALLSSALAGVLYNSRVRGNACSLTTILPDKDFIDNITALSRNISIGVGAGLSLDYLNRFIQHNNIKATFMNTCKTLNSSTLLYTSERKSKLAIYLSLHKSSVLDVLYATRLENPQFPNIFFGLMIPDLFIKRVRSRQKWYFFDDCPELNNCFGEKYERLYNEMVDAGKYTDCMDALDLLIEIRNLIQTTGLPYIHWRDTINRYNNQRDLGIISSSNLCCEIMQTSMPQYGDSMCHIATVNVAMLDYFDDQAFESIADMVSTIIDVRSLFKTRWHQFVFTSSFLATLMLNDLLTEIHSNVDDDKIAYAYELYLKSDPTPILTREEFGRLANNDHRREIAVSPTGVYDLYLLVKQTVQTYDDFLPLFAEILYFAAVLGSAYYFKTTRIQCKLYPKTEFAKGRFQFDLRGHTPKFQDGWKILSKLAATEGLSNSMLVSYAPAATTSLYYGVCESISTPPNDIVTKSGSRRIADVPYITRTKKISYETERPTIIQQLKRCASVAPFVDGSQSTCIQMKADPQSIETVFAKSFDFELKGLYYPVFDKTGAYINLISPGHNSISCTSCIN